MKTPVIRSDWTDDRVEALEKLWKAGLSAAQIAKEIGGITRNAVIGKAHRSGFGKRREGFAAQQAVHESKRAGGKGWRATRATRTPKQRDRVKLVGDTVFIEGPNRL